MQTCGLHSLWRAENYDKRNSHDYHDDVLTAIYLTIFFPSLILYVIYFETYLKYTSVHVDLSADERFQLKLSKLNIFTVYWVVESVTPIAHSMNFIVYLIRIPYFRSELSNMISVHKTVSTKSHWVPHFQKAWSYQFLENY